MKTDSSQLLKLQAIRKELEKTALQKVSAIQDKILTHKSEFPVEDIQILTIVNDELDDILLNWELNGIDGMSQVLSMNHDDLEECDD